jgi:hypothetical protein
MAEEKKFSLGSLAGLLLVPFVVCALLLAAAVGIGWLLHRLLPTVDFGLAILIGLVAIPVTGKICSFLADLLLGSVSLSETEEDEEPEPEPERVFHYVSSLPPKRRRRRRS